MMQNTAAINNVVCLADFTCPQNIAKAKCNIPCAQILRLTDRIRQARGTQINRRNIDIFHRLRHFNRLLSTAATRDQNVMFAAFKYAQIIFRQKRIARFQNLRRLTQTPDCRATPAWIGILLILPLHKN